MAIIATLAVLLLRVPGVCPEDLAARCVLRHLAAEVADELHSEGAPAVVGDKEKAAALVLHDAQDAAGGQEAEVGDGLAEARTEPERADVAAVVLEDEDAAAQFRVIARGLCDADDGICRAVAVDIGRLKTIYGKGQCPAVMAQPDDKEAVGLALKGEFFLRGNGREAEHTAQQEHRSHRLSSQADRGMNTATVFRRT